MTKVQLEESDAEQLLDDLRAGEGREWGVCVYVKLHSKVQC